MKSLHVGLLLLVSLVCCLPRAPENVSLFGQASAALSWQSAAAQPMQDKVDGSLLHVRKFRRRKMAFFFCVHIAASYLASPLQRITARFSRTVNLLISRSPDPLVHPPA